MTEAETVNTAQKTVVVKVGTSSITTVDGTIDQHRVNALCDEVAALKAADHQVVVVTSGAIAAGLPALGLGGAARPKDAQTLQAVSAVGQGKLIGTYQSALSRHGLLAGQVLLTPLDFFLRAQYLHARSTLTRLLELGAVPIVNENDAVADDEIRWGDNDRIAALVAHLVDADLLVLLTDIEGVLSADPKLNPQASLIEEIVEVDHDLEQLAGGSGSLHGSGGMASKLAAAKIASWSGVRTVIAHAHRPQVLADALAAKPGIGTTVHARPNRLGARRLWIAFAVGSSGRITVDAGARKVLEERRVSLLPAGVTGVDGDFEIGQAVEIIDENQIVFAKGLVRQNAATLRDTMGTRSTDLNAGVSPEVIHADDLVVLPN
ncbi:MAG: glutamate 5-kinase [Actinobacteria bacterium]|jgi:glutamate 5-kinase|nr:glutamate 5-kinase [Actinomycetota bacterium]MBT3746956.1 glutamate 5-kinase [Actinomycetota bacterium]MBT3970508.1 glutamate 5-kinase [Actinomycetota bacterium]MBT4008904.1 glutamate 5-kinase [Actinomycetota bacterium]MBT4302765.1 glutamate 5-kinase [Actinomycetota bacterium]